jgi:hypothetical protein
MGIALQSMEGEGRNLSPTRFAAVPGDTWLGVEKYFKV